MKNQIAKKITPVSNVCIGYGNKILEIKRNDIHKGTIVHRMMMEKKPTFALSMGDDVADEEMHKVLNQRKDTMSIKVGLCQNTKAQYQIQSYKEAIQIIENISNYNNNNSFMDILK